MQQKPYDIILIGGSAGCIQICVKLLRAYSPSCGIPLVLVIHRLRNATSVLHTLLAGEAGITSIIEPEDKMPIKAGNVYLAPQNYHLLFEREGSFGLDDSDPVHYSRPSIDVSFESAGYAFGDRVLTILLSGATADGATALAALARAGATCLVQDPATAEYPTMPLAAIEVGGKHIQVMRPEEISSFITHL